MTKNEQHSGWIAWLSGHGIWGALLVGGLLTAVVFGLAYFLDSRLDRMEGRREAPPATRYTPPNLDDFAADDFSADAVVVGQTVYVPVYSHVYHRSGVPYLIETTLSIRNTDMKRPIYVRSVRYYDTMGELVETYVDRTIRLAPLQTIEFLVPRRDTAGGSGANFIVEWCAMEPVNPPIVEAVMVGSTGSQGIGFRTSGEVLTP